MKKINIMWLFILIISITIFILQIFVFEAPNGTPGFLLCLSCVYGMGISTVQLYKRSEKFKMFMKALSTVFFG